MPAELELPHSLPFAESLLQQIDSSKKSANFTERVGISLMVCTSSIVWNSALDEQGLYQSLADNPERILIAGFIFFAGVRLLKSARDLRKQIRHVEENEGIVLPVNEIELFID
jgi:hypothetical protein